MAQEKLGRRLRAQDAAFLYAEREEAPLHIGSIAVFEGQVSYSRFVNNIASKLHLIPRYLQRAVPAPFNIGHPTWEWDPDFDLAHHVKHVTVEAPGADAQLFDLAADLFASILDRDKPLWEMYIVDGLEGGNSALITKVHHCLVDGVSGIELLMIVMDVSPNPPPPIAGELPERRPLPGPLSRLIDAVFDNMADSLDRLAEQQKALVDAATLGNSRARAVMRAVETAAPYLTTPVERTPFNKPLSTGRKLACSEFSFAEIRAIRQACGGTVNDVVLAVLGGALSRYVAMHGEKTEGRMARIMTPVNVRREDEGGALGNRVSALLVEVPLGVHNPVERLRLVRERTESLKRSRVADGTELLGQLINSSPPIVQALAAAMPPPPNNLVNMICTNVPGPMIPLYSVGQRLLAHYPMVPLAWEMGVACGVTSYDQKLYFGLMADAEAAPDVQRLKEFLDQSFIELRSAAGVGKSDLPLLGVAADGARRRRTGTRASESLAADAG